TTSAHFAERPPADPCSLPIREISIGRYAVSRDLALPLFGECYGKQAMLVRQLEEELRMRMRGPSIEMQQQMESLYQENEHLTREIAILRDTIKVRAGGCIETQKQTLQARDESIKKLLEMLQNKGMVVTVLVGLMPRVLDLFQIIGSKQWCSGVDGSLGDVSMTMVVVKQAVSGERPELQAANETLRTLQNQLELVPSPSSSTVRVLLDTKDARIATLEREIRLLESEVDRLGGGTNFPRRLPGTVRWCCPLNDNFTTSLSLGTHVSRMDSACLRSCVQLDEFRVEIQRRDQEILAMGAKMKTLEEQHQDYQRHIAVLKESLCAKEEHYNMLQADVEELRLRLDEKNRLIEKKTQQHQQERGRYGAEIAELKEHMDIKDRKINVLQRKPHHMLQTEEEVLDIVEDDPSTSTREIARQVNVSQHKDRTIQFLNIGVVQENPNDLASRKRIILTWAPGHSGVRRNEEAHRLVRKGPATNPIRPELTLGVPFSAMKELLAKEFKN
ncbi:hypothetical protein NQ317_018923, partial [Molorchus minor]